MQRCLACILPRFWLEFQTFGDVEEPRSHLQTTNTECIQDKILESLKVIIHTLGGELNGIPVMSNMRQISFCFLLLNKEVSRNALKSSLS